MTNVIVVSTPDDGTCGIGTYTGSLAAALPGAVDPRPVHIELGAVDPVEYLRAAARVATADGSVVHVQHEYGIFGPKSIMSWLFFPLLFVVSRVRGLPVVLTAHSVWNRETIGPPLEPLKRVYVWLNNRMLALVAHHIVFLSEATHEKFRASVPGGYCRTEVIPHGVQVRTMDLARTEAKEHFGFDEDDTVIVEPGYVRPEKGTDRFVSLADHLPEHEFLVAGGGQEGYTEFASRVAEEASENVTVTGQLSDELFHAAFVAADVVVLPYRTVSQSGVFNWCAAYERPVVASDLSYFRRLRSEWGCVQLCDPEDVDAMATRVSELLADPDSRERIVEGMVEFRESHSMERVAERHRTLYQSYDDP